MGYLGDFAEDRAVRGSFNSRSLAGVPITLAGTPSLVVYKDGSTTESTAGVAAIAVDFDGRTGHNVFTVDTSADAFYATGSDYRIVLAAGTVDGVSVAGVEVASFSIQNRSVALIRTKAEDETADTAIIGAIPSASAVAGQVRTELTDELDEIGTVLAEVGKIPRSASAITAGGNATRTKVSANGTTLVETIS